MLRRIDVARGKIQVKPFVSNRKSPGSLPMGRLNRDAIHNKNPIPTINRPKRINQRAIELKSGIAVPSYRSGRRA
jgi:hypothetical protein